jgi:hypothetical protein
MKTKIFTFLLGAFFLFSASAQKPTGEVVKASVAPEIDGVLDDVWAEANVYNIDVNFQTETPSLGQSGDTNFRILWDEASAGIYVFVTVADDNYFPFYVSNNGAGYENDKIETYWDVNFVLEDGGSATSPGHYQVAPDLALALESGAVTTGDDGVVHAFMVTNPSYVAEYFVPFSKLLNSDGGMFDGTSDFGFDVTVVDTDPDAPVRSRAVWANDGLRGAATESWNNLDEVGTMTLLEIGDKVYMETLEVADAAAITTDDGTVQMTAIIAPENTTNKFISWSVENESGRASISSTGVLTGIVDGTVRVIAKSTDGSFLEAETIVTISNQFVWSEEVNLIKNGNFKQVDANGRGEFWGGWTDASPAHTVAEGVSVHTPVGQDNNWNYQFSQEGFKAVPNTPYTLSFVAWADADRTFTVDFEDTANSVPIANRRYGFSADPRAVDGRSEWTFDVTTEPTRYTFDVTFDEITPTTVEKLQFMIGTLPTVTYIDSVSVISDVDMVEVVHAVSVPTTEASATVTVSPVPAVDVINVAGANANAAVEVYNSVGQKVAVAKAGANGDATIAVSSFAKGLYFVKTSGAVVKFVK